jgi:acyl transferase domain-containing protein
MQLYREMQPAAIRLPNHAAFHSSLMQSASDLALAQLNSGLFKQAKVPLIDGRAKVWQPLSSDPTALWDYTLGQQIIQPYDFSKAVQVGVQEFAPDCLIILGPGNTLGGACVQALIEINWQGLSSKRDFTARQKNQPLLISMGLNEQRPRVLS